MRVTFVEFAGKGGMIHYAWQLCTAMAKEGAEVTLVTDQSYELDVLPHNFAVVKLMRLWDSKGELASGAIARKLQRGVRGVRYYAEWERLAAYLKRSRPDVVQFGDIRFPTDLVPLAQIRRSGLLLADICHNVQPFSLAGRSAGRFSGSRWKRTLYRRIYEQFRLVFVHFDVNRHAFEETFGRTKALETIVHGNEEIFEPLRNPAVTADSVRRELGIAPDAEVVLLFGTLSRYKGIDLLVEAFARIRAERPRARLVLAGFPVGGLTVEEVEEQAQRAGVAGAVTVVPRYIESDRVAAWMQMASAVVFPYESVFQSGALHVPLTFGRPVVATNVGAMAEVIDDHRTGRLVPPRDPGALAGAIHALLAHPQQAAQIGRAAAEDQRTRFSWSRNAQTMLEAYRRVLR